jgi:hypothetical protein
MARPGHGPRDGTDAVDAAATDAGPMASSAGARALLRRRVPRAHLRPARSTVALNAKTAHRRFGDGGKVDLNVGLGLLMKAFRWSGVPSSPRRRRHRVVDARRLGEKHGRASGRVRARHPHGLRWTLRPARWRTRRRNVGEQVERARGPERLVDDERGRRPQYVPADIWRDQRHLRRAPPGSNPTPAPSSASGENRKRVWHFQTVHPICSTMTTRRRHARGHRVNGRSIKALVQVARGSCSC